MNIQIIGTKKCKDTRKAERFFSDRGIKYHFRDLNVKGLSKGELDNIKRSFDIEELIDREGKEYSRLNLQYITHDPEEKILEYPLLLNTPVVRNGGKTTLGVEEQTWKEWIKES